MPRRTHLGEFQLQATWRRRWVTSLKDDVIPDNRLPLRDHYRFAAPPFVKGECTSNVAPKRNQRQSARATQ
jgi:hypothetical protein